MSRLLLRRAVPWLSVGLKTCGPPQGASSRQVGGQVLIQLRRLYSARQDEQATAVSLWSQSARKVPQKTAFQDGAAVSTTRSTFSTGRRNTLRPARSLAAPSLEKDAPVSKTVAEALREWRGPGTTQRQVRVYVDDAGKEKGSTTSSPPPNGPSNSSQKPHYEPPTPPNQKPSQGHDYFRDFPAIPRLHRPSRDELLAAASGFFSRMKVRFKWASIRSMRPFNIDEIGAFISLVAFGHVLWLFIGTTTFISLAIFAMNTVFAQETLAKRIGNYLTKSSGLQVVFESAVVPKWGDGVISFHNVFVSRRPGLGKGTVSKGSPQTAAAAQAAAAEADRENLGRPAEEEDQNYTQFDVSIDTVNVTLSFTKWWNSKGLLKDVEVKGVRGVIDRTHVHHIEGVDPRSYKHEHQAGDFEIEDFRLEDVLVTLHQPSGFRPFSVSIYSCELPRLRKQWLFYDFLCANHCSGAFDDAQFNIHPRQMHGHVGLGNDEDLASLAGENPWRKHNRLRIDGLSIDHLNRGVEGPFGWITQGNVDIVSDVMFPADPDESISKVVAEMYSKVESTITDKFHLQFGPDKDAIYHDDAQDDFASQSQAQARSLEAKPEADRRCIVMDLRVRINDIHATPPAFPKNISYIDNALIRPIVAFLNSRPSWVPINGRLVKRVTDFDGSWTLFDSGLMDEVSEELYDSCVRDLQDSDSRARRFRKVGIWSLQLVAQALFIGLVGNIS